MSVRVLHLLACDDWGGTEVQVATQVLRTDRARTPQAVATLAPPGQVNRAMREAGVPAHSLAGAGGPLGAALRLARLLRRAPVDVLQAYGLRAGVVARLAMAAAGRRPPSLVIGVRGLHFTEGQDPRAPKTRLALAVERAMSVTVARYDANSRGARDFLVEHGFPARKLGVIPNGVETQVPVAGAPHRPPVVVCTARFVPRKRHDVLIDAFARVRDRGVDARLRLIGYGPTQAACAEQSRRLGLADRVEFLGRLPQGEVTAALAGADLFTLTSLWEGMPGSVLEAMAAGLATVATQVNGTDEVVQHGVTGLLVPPGDPEALADALEQLLRDEGRRAGMGRAARRRAVEDHGFGRLVERKTALYEAIAAGRP